METALFILFIFAFGIPCIILIYGLWKIISLIFTHIKIKRLQPQLIKATNNLNSNDFEIKDELQEGLLENFCDTLGIFDHEAIIKNGEIYHKVTIKYPVPDSFNEAIMCRDYVNFGFDRCIWDHDIEKIVVKDFKLSDNDFTEFIKAATQNKTINTIYTPVRILTIKLTNKEYLEKIEKLINLSDDKDCPIERMRIADERFKLFTLGNTDNFSEDDRNNAVEKYKEALKFYINMTSV